MGLRGLNEVLYLKLLLKYRAYSIHLIYDTTDTTATKAVLKEDKLEKTPKRCNERAFNSWDQERQVGMNLQMWQRESTGLGDCVKDKGKGKPKDTNLGEFEKCDNTTRN